MRNLIPLALASSFLLVGACIVESADDDDADTETETASGGGPITATMGESESATTSPTSSSGGEETGSSGGSSGSADTTGSDTTGTDPGEQVGSCRDDPLENCMDYVGPGYVPEAFPMGCPDIFSEDPCPTDGVVFSCALMQGDLLEAHVRYYPPWSAKGAAQDCDNASGVPI